MEIIKKRKKFNRKVKNAKKIFIMAHKNLDLDALGSSIGIYKILKKKKKDCYIIIDDKIHELGVEKILKELDGCLNIINGNKVKELLHKNARSNLLIILDTNKKELVQNESILKLISNKIIIDHHSLGKKTIKDALIIHDDNVSSTCEMITNLIETYDVDIDGYFATILLSGIVLDTNNFTLKTTAETYYAAYYLASLGASAKKVQYLLKQDIIEYTERQKLLSRLEVVNEKIAFSKATSYTIYRKEDLAKIADTLLFFNDIEASFVIGKIDKNIVGVSARSLGSFNISNILEKLGGGGDDCNGAVTFKKKTITQVEKMLKNEIKKQEGEGKCK